MPHQYSNSAVRRANAGAIHSAIAGLALAAVAIRLAVMLATPPDHGDAASSYAYRAVLLLDGRWSAVWATAHPPGFSLLLALISLASGGLLSPWWAGELVTLVCTGALILLAD